MKKKRSSTALADPDDCVSVHLWVDGAAEKHTPKRLFQICERFGVPLLESSSGKEVSPEDAALSLHDPWEKTDLRARVEETNRMTVLLSGYCTEGPVTFTALRALGDGYDVFIVLDAIADDDDWSGEVARGRLYASGVVPTTTRQIGFEMLQSRGDPAIAGDVKRILGVS